MSLRREPGRVVIVLKTKHVQAVAMALAGAIVGVGLFFLVKPLVPSLDSTSADGVADSVSWLEAPRIDVAVEGRPSLGSADAPVTIVEFTDYGCSVCRRHATDVLPALLDTLGASIHYVVRHFPIPGLTPNGMLAAIASECAHEQGLFWEYKQALLGEAAGFDGERLRARAATVGLDRAEFDACLEGEAARETVQRDILDAWDHGVTGTPTFFVNGRRFQGARPLGELAEYVRLAMIEAEGLH